MLLTGTLTTAIAQNPALDSLETVLQNTSGKERISLLITLSDNLFYSDTRKSRTFAREALILSTDYGDSINIINAYNLIGITFDIDGIKDSSRYYFKKFYEESKVQRRGDKMSAALNNLGMWHWNKGLFDEALTYYFEARGLADSLSNFMTLSMAYNNIGLIYQELNNFEKALEYNRNALNLRIVHGFERSLSHSYNNIGICHLRLGNLDSAEFYYRKGLDQALEINNRESAANILQNLGNLEMKRKNINDAIAYYHTSVSYSKNPVSKLLMYNSLCEAYLKKGQPSVAIEQGEKALAIASETDNFGHTEDLYFNLTQAYMRNGDYEKAVEGMQQWDIVKDSLFSEESARVYNELEVKYETARKEQRIALQQAEIDEQDAVLVRDRIGLFAAILTIVLLVIIFFQWRSRVRKKQQIAMQEAQLDLKEAEIRAAIASREKERARYARDLHDGFGQMISILNINIGSLRKDMSSAERMKIFEQSEKVIDTMYEELKGICFDLMPQTLIRQGLSSALQEFADRINVSGKVYVETGVFGLEERPDQVLEVSLFRISQEWINNVLKYAGASKINLQITSDEQEITLLIEDDGEGFDTAVLKQGTGNGWRNIESRSNLIGGEIVLESSERRRGTTFILNAPVRKGKSNVVSMIES